MQARKIVCARLRDSRPSAVHFSRRDPVLDIQRGQDAGIAGHWPDCSDCTGTVLQYKRYLDEMPGIALGDSWEDISPVQGSAKERTCYPTQKPLALLQRIIRASSNEGDVVMDPFCGCATACVAAHELNRRWVGIDVSAKAFDLVRQRIEDRGGLFYSLNHREDVPQRTDLGAIPRYNAPENKTRLYGEQEGHCAGCDSHFEARHLTIDHIIARSKGGTDHLGNLQLLCGNCNAIKGDRGMEYLVARLAR